jgi:hypothetical protein
MSIESGTDCLKPSGTEPWTIQPTRLERQYGRLMRSPEGDDPPPNPSLITDPPADPPPADPPADPPPADPPADPSKPADPPADPPAPLTVESLTLPEGLNSSRKWQANFSKSSTAISRRRIGLNERIGNGNSCRHPSDASRSCRRRTDPDGNIADIVEIMNQTNEVLDDMVWQEGNLVTGHRTTVPHGSSGPTWRKMYGGVQPTKSKTAQVTDNTGMLEAYAEVDKALADLNGNTAAFRSVGGSSAHRRRCRGDRSDDCSTVTRAPSRRPSPACRRGSTRPRRATATT